ncbi:XdhC family protein [Maribacter luteus]|uniref:XdhC family protein n=1 Tax=Maribacter luteus TaxID=2594478 RepID=UPI002493B8D4|nr:XdhC/CoxI family protein [Maribacter luteus]
MTHEFKNIVKTYISAKEKQLKTVLATVVDLDGSSYRRPGVRMLILEDGRAVGAVSGGCVEKEVIRQAQSVLENGIPKMMTYDGRYRLGCEGLLYILIEPFEPNEAFLSAFDRLGHNRNVFTLQSYYTKTEGTNISYGSIMRTDNNDFSFGIKIQTTNGLEVFTQKMKPCFKLLIIGAEHDAVQLSGYASLTGWEVTIVAPPSEQKKLKDFPGAQEMLCVDADDLDIDQIDNQTAVLIMTHNYVKDLKFLIRIKESKPAYIGILGPMKRREKLMGELIERYPEIDDAFFDSIYGPSGLNIGAETAQEICIAIMAEILSVTRKQEPIMLKDKLSAIHC